MKFRSKLGRMRKEHNKYEEQIETLAYIDMLYNAWSDVINLFLEYTIIAFEAK